MTNQYKTAIISFVCFPIMLIGGGNDILDYKFHQAENYYSFRGNFFVTADPDSLVDLIYNFKNISGYAAGAESINLVGEGENWYDVSFTYRKLVFFKSQSTWHRILRPNDRKIEFEMLSNTTNLNLIPTMNQSSGYYQIKPAGTGSHLMYFQESRLNSGILRDTYINLVVKEALVFLCEFREFIEKNCSEPSSRRIQ